MKKIISLLFCTILFLICTSKASAEEIKYGNLITDETTIEEDFKLLGLSINDYYKPSYNYSKWYVVAMSEAYIDEENYDIQTYFYLYNPTRFGEGSDHMSTVSDFTLTYELKNAEILYKSHGSKLDYNREHLIYKVKGFAYKYSPSAEISITKIQHFNLRGLGITNDSNFKATAKHSKVNGFSVELNFNSTLIIDDIEVVSLQIEDSEKNIFKYIFSGELFEDTFKGGVTDSTLQLYFYNFNFPENIKPDSIEYAYFELKKELWQQKWQRYGDAWREEYHKIVETKELNYELYPEDLTFDIGNKAEKLNFPRFYLGDRYKDKQFGDLSFEKLDAAKFDRDCSIFLDYNYEVKYKRYSNAIGNIQPDLEYRDYSKLKDVELLELWYKKNGITYKCQIVSNPTDSEPVYPERPKSLWDKIKEIIIKIVDWILNNVFQTDSKAFPEEAKLAIGFVLCVVALIVLPYIIKFLIYLIKLPFKIFK